MRRFSAPPIRYAFAILTLALLSGGPIAAQPQLAAGAPQDPGSGSARAPREVEGELLVRFRRGTSNGARTVARADAGANLIRAFRTVPDLEQVRLPQGESVSAALARYRSRADVVYAEPNYVLHTLQSQTMPNDPDFGQLWGLHNAGQSGGTPNADINAPEAWSITTGSSNVVVAVIDTGTDYTHPDLAANMFRNTADCNANGVDDDGNGYIDDCYGIDTANHDSDPMDDHGHGTHTAGTIGAAGNNGAGVVGVNWNVSVMACKFLKGNGSGSTADAVACLDYVRIMKDRGVNIVATSNSWGGGGYSQALYDAIDAQRQRGILFIAAAGNAAADNDGGGHYPAGYDLPNIISVAATSRTDDLAWFSNVGRHSVHLGAPGLDILSTTPNNTYSTFSGTSMATPHVSGVAALLKAADPSRDWRAIKNLLLASGDTLPSLANTVTRKRLNAYSALTCSNSVVTSRLHPATSFVSATVNEPITLAMLNINCANPNGPVSVTVNPGGWTIPLADDGTGNDQAADDGVYTGTFVPAIEQTYTLTFPGGDVVTVAFPQTYSVTPVPYAYRTITGTNLNLLDDKVVPVTPPFPLSFGGVELPTVFVGDNGVLSFSGGITSYFNLWLPAGALQTAVAPFWDDIRPSGPQNVYWDVIGTAPHRELVIEWRDLPMWYCPTGGTLTFEAVFFEGSSDILFNYLDTVVGDACAWADHGADATVGVQVAPARATQFSYNAGTIDDQTALLWTLQPPPASPAMNVVPAAVDFGTAILGTAVDRTLTVQNVGGGTLTGTVTTTAPFSVVSGGAFSLGPYASQPVVVRFHPTAEATFTGSATVVSNAATASVPLTGAGTTHTLAIVPPPTSVTVSIGPVDGIPLSATGGNGTYAWSLLSGDLPPGVAIRTDLPPFSPSGASAGLIGVATTAGTYAFTLRVTSGTETADVSSVIKVTSLTVKDGNHFGSVPEAAVGEPYNYQLTAINGAGPVTWGTGGFGLPPGITLTPGGLLSGTPTSPGYYWISVSVTDGVDTISRRLTLPVNSLHITTPGVLPNATAGAAYSMTVTASGGTPPYTFGGGCCIPGLNFTSNGTLSGTIPAYMSPGVSSLYVYVQDSQGHWYNEIFSLDIVKAPQPLPSLSLYLPLDDCTVGMTCSRGIGVRGGGTAPFTWTAAGLPPGTSLRPAVGSQSDVVSGGSSWGYGLTAGDAEIWGVPTATGTFNATVTVIDATGASATGVIPFTVSPLLHPGSLSTPTFNVPYSDTVRVIGGALPYTGMQISGEVPAGITFDPASFHLSGTPVENGSFNPVFEFTDADGATYTTTEHLSIWSPSSLNIYPGGDMGTISVGSPYTMQLYACCGNSYTWSIVDGMLPDGVTLSSSSGLLSGTPTTAGTFTFLVRVVDPSNSASVGQRQLRIRVVSDPLLMISSGWQLPAGNVGDPYAQTLSATGGTGPLSWSLVLGNYLPPGVTLSAAGVISGTPAATGQFNFSIAVTDGTQTATQWFNVSIYAAGQPPPVSQSQGPQLGTWSIGQVEFPLFATGGNGTYTWSVVGGSLPPGLSLRDDPPPWNQSTTTIGGVATTPGTYTFTLRVASGTSFADQQVTLRITGLTIKDGNAFSYLPDAFVGTPYSYALTALGAAGPVTFSSPYGLPPGLTLGADGLISGSPTAEGYYWISFSVSDGVDTIWRGVALPVSTVNITTPGVLPNATRGAAYSVTMTASGGTSPYTFSGGWGVPGLDMSPDGTLSGTVSPFAPLGPARVYVHVTDANMQTFTRWMSIDIVDGSGTPPLQDAMQYANSDVLDDCTVGMVCSRGIAVSGGGTAPFTWSASGLPPGLSLRSATGSQNEYVSISHGWGASLTAGDLEIWGVPTATGTFAVAVTVTDADGAATTQIYELKIAALAQWNTLAYGTIGEPYSQKLRLLGGTLPYTGALSSGALPAGLTFDPASMTLSGVPNESGSFNPVFTFTDAGGASMRLTDGLTLIGKNITIYGVGSFSNTRLPAALIGSAYWYWLPACCAPAYQWSIVGGALPPGFSLNSDGLLSGTGAAPGIYSFLVRVENPADSANTYTQRQFTLAVVDSLLQINGSILPPAHAGQSYMTTLTASGSNGPLTWTAAPFNLPPPGLTLGAGGVLSGTPQQAGHFAFAVTVTDGIQTAAATVLLTVSEATVTSIAITPAAAALNPGQAQCFVATLLLSDGSIQTTDPNCATPAGMVPPAWTSTNPAAVTVDVNGLAIAVAPGQADIIAASGGISCQPSGSCATVTVTSPAIVTSMSMAPAAGAFGADVTLSATLTASGAPLAGQIITFTLNGTAVGAMATNASGVATLPGVSLAGIDVGVYPGAVSATFAGNSAFLPVTAAGDLTVVGPPVITVTSPIEPIYERGSTVLAAYSCGTATCIGDVANGAPIDTSTSGFKSFQIVATDAFGNTSTAFVTYAVSLGSPISPIGGLSAWLPGDGSARDLVNGTQAAWMGADAYGAGKVAQAFALDGMSTVSLPLAQPGPFTLQSWIRVPNRLQPEFTGIISTGASGQSAETFQLELDGFGNLRLNAGNGDLSVLIGPAADFFQHVAVSFDGTWISVYLNGQLVERDMWTSALGFQVLNIGIDRDGLRSFTGLVDEVHVFNRALTDGEVLQTFLAGASGFRKNHAPVAAATATPNPAEATGPNGAMVVLDGAGSTDADGDLLTYTWSEAAIVLGGGATLPVQLSLGAHAITLTVDDGYATASTEINVTVADTTGPAISLPPTPIVVEATGPLGAVVTFTVSAEDSVTGPASVICLPPSGSVFPIATTMVLCSAQDSDGNAATAMFPVTVVDTTAPAATITSPSTDAMLTAPTSDVMVQVTDTVGVSAVLVNGVAATRTSGTAQAGTWKASLPVAPGTALTIGVSAADAAGNAGPATKVIDNDGIPSIAPAALDRNRTTGADQAGVFSSDFNNGVTAGTLVRNGWTMKLSNAPTANNVRVQVSGTGTSAAPARVLACIGAAKEVRLDVAGETADIACEPFTGTIAVKAVSASPRIEVWKQISPTTRTSAQLSTGAQYSTGSPATAAATNTAPITVNIVQADAAGAPTVVVGQFDLAPGASVDVRSVPAADGREGVEFRVLRGVIPVRAGGRTHSLKAGSTTIVMINR